MYSGVEGSVPTYDDGVYCCIGGRSAEDILQETAAGAKAIIGWGSCACNGCVQAAKPNPTGATPIHKLVKGKPIIKVPGCPPIGEVMAGVLVHLVTFGRIPEARPHWPAKGLLLQAGTRYLLPAALL